MQPVAGGAVIAKVGVQCAGQAAQPGGQAGQLTLLRVLAGEVCKVGKVRSKLFEQSAGWGGLLGGHMLASDLSPLVHLGSGEDVPQIGVHPAADLVELVKDGNGRS